MRLRKNQKAVRNDIIKKEFQKLTGVGKHMKSAYAIRALSDKYFVSEGTIEDIVYEVGNYKPKPVETNQLSLF